MNFYTFNASLDIDDPTSGYPYKISGGGGGKYKQK
jgi:hypothetical protein